MKHLLLTTIAAVLLVGWGESQPPEPPNSFGKTGEELKAEGKRNISAATVKAP